MHDATNGKPLENQSARGNRDPRGVQKPYAEAAVRDDDDVIRLNWREKLVDFGMMMAMVTCGMMIGMIIIIASLIAMRSTFEEMAPGFSVVPAAQIERPDETTAEVPGEAGHSSDAAGAVGASGEDGIARR